MHYRCVLSAGLVLCASFLLPCLTAAAAPEENYAVVIGINGYDRSLGRLEYCVADARAVRDQLVRGGQFPPGNVVLMTDDSEPQSQPTYGRLRRRLKNLADHPGRMHTLLVFFSGHGIRTPDGRQRLIPLDGAPGLGLELDTVRDWIAAAGAEHSILILDCCHAGQGAKGLQGIVPDLEAAVGTLVLASCAADQTSHDDEEAGHGVFSAYLAAGLSGEADADEDRTVTADELFQYVENGVSGWAFRRNVRQTPVALPPGAGSEVSLARIPETLEPPEIEIPEFKLPEETLPGVDLPEVSGTALERFGELKKLLEEKQAEIKEKSEWYAENSQQIKALRSQEGALRGRLERAALAAIEALQAELKAIESAWKEGERKGLKPGHPEMRKLAEARTKARWRLESLKLEKYGLSLQREIDLGDGVTMKLVLIPPGEFMMGSRLSPSEVASRYGCNEYGFEDEHPRHRVRITKPFYMGVTEVTNAQYRQFLADSGYDGTGDADVTYL